MIALNAAMASPSAISAGVLCGKEPSVPPSFFPGSADVGVGVFSSLEETSTREIKMTPTREATTPMTLRIVSLSTPMNAPNSNVHTPLVDVRIVVLPTVVYCKHANAK